MFFLDLSSENLYIFSYFSGVTAPAQWEVSARLQGSLKSMTLPAACPGDTAGQAGQSDSDPGDS